MIAVLLLRFSLRTEGSFPEPDFTHLGGLVVPKKESKLFVSRRH